MIPRAMATDRNGNPVAVGARVRILGLSGTWLDELPNDERDRIRRMIGETFRIDEIDEFGAPWVTKEFAGESPDQVFSHSIALAAGEMLVVDEEP
jgi:hypothetical protein